MRNWSVAAAGLLGVMLVAAVAPAAAQAAEIRQVLVSNNNDTDAGLITVTVYTDEPVAAVHADFIDQGTTLIGGTADDFVLTGQYSGRFDYETARPVVMEPGRYDVDVTVTDADGAVTRHSGDSIAYEVVATVEDVHLDRSVIDWDDRDVTVTGVLRGRWPGTGETRPIGGAEVANWVHLNSSDPISTAADGTFRRTFTMSGALDTIELWYGGGSAHTRAGATALATVTVAPQRTRVSMRVDKRRAVAGEQLTLTGRVERLSAAGWVPTPPQTELWIRNGCAEAGCAFDFDVVQVTADGTFRVQTVATRTGYLDVAVRGQLSFFAGSTAKTKVVTVTPAA